MLQLPPVGKNLYYLFDCMEFTELMHELFFLDEVVRQSDPAMSASLNRLRCGKWTQQDREDALTWGQRLRDDPTAPRVRLVFTNQERADHNTQELGKLLAAGVEDTHFLAEDGTPHGAPPLSATMLSHVLTAANVTAERDLHLAVGAVVMAIRNDHQRKIYNGTTGVVVGLDKATGSAQVRVRDPDGTNERVVVFERERFEAHEPGSLRCTAFRLQLPLTLAFAITVHKAVGLTLDAAEVKLIRGTGAQFGMAYVALSRCRRKEDILILELDPAFCKAPKAPLAFEAGTRFSRRAYDAMLARPTNFVLNVAATLVAGPRVAQDIGGRFEDASSGGSAKRPRTDSDSRASN